MKHEIKHRHTNEILFSIETDSFRSAVEAAVFKKIGLRYADLSYADLRYTNLRYADLSYADLSSANLRYANLRYADLSYADLSSADLRYADLSYADLLVFQFQMQWVYYTFDGMLRIGCESHTIAKWVKEYKEIGNKNNYSPIQIEMYGQFIKMCAKHYKQNKKEAK
jgi:hypothetical protein